MLALKCGHLPAQYGRLKAAARPSQTGQMRAPVRSFHTPYYLATFYGTSQHRHIRLRKALDRVMQAAVLGAIAVAAFVALQAGVGALTPLVVSTLTAV